MKLHDLKPADGARHRTKRVGRGRSSGIGKTSGRGTKGTKARRNVPPGFAGGQMPLQRRLPKWGGFTPRNRVEYAVVNVARLESTFEQGSVVGPEEMHLRGLVRKGMPVKVLGNGAMSKSMTVRAHRFSSSAGDKIEQAGGRAEVI